MIDGTGSDHRPSVESARAKPDTAKPTLAMPPRFVEVPMPSSPVAPEIRIELRRGATAVNVIWPAAAAADCAARMRKLLASQL